MMTFKDLKKLVELPSYKEQRVPTVKALEVSGVPVVAEKILENHGSISVYQNGYVIYRAHKRVTVFSLRNCVHYKYDALEGAGHHIEEEEFDEYEWHIRLVLEGEDRIFMNYEIIQGKWMPSREDREYKEEILEGVDEAVSTLERMISEERVEELLSTLTDLQRKVVHIHLFHLPNLTVAAPTEQHPTGRWGRLHKTYLKKQHPIRYNQLLLSGELGSYLAKLDKQAEEQLALTVRQMQEAEGVTEALKAADQLEWVRRMNSIRNRAEEIIKSELIFV